MTTTVEFAGQDLAEAIAAAAGALNLPPEKLKFSVVEMGTKGFLGLGRRRARIAVDPADPALFLDEPPPSAAPPPEGGRPPAPIQAAGAEEPAAPPPDPPAETPPDLPPAAAGPKTQEPSKKSRGSAPPRPFPFPDLAPLTRLAAGEIREDDPKDETALLARAVVGDILSRLGLAADLTLVRLGPRLVVNLDGPDRALLIGARGATLEALQLLASKIMAKKRPGEGGRLVLDVADYRSRRQHQVLENLKFLVEAARRTGQVQPLTGLSSAERRLVRLALRPVKDLDLKAAGRGREGGLVLAPAALAAGRRPRRKQKGES